MSIQRHSGGAVHDDGGFTLVEVIVSMVLLGLVAIAMLPVMATGAKTAAANRDLSKAAQYANTELLYARQWIASGKCISVKNNISGNAYLAPRVSTADPSAAYVLATRPGYAVADTFTGTCTKGQTVRVASTVTSTSDAAKTVTVTTLVLVP